jgi:hypothetical protein
MRSNSETNQSLRTRNLEQRPIKFDIDSVSIESVLDALANKKYLLSSQRRRAKPSSLQLLTGNLPFRLNTAASYASIVIFGLADPGGGNDRDRLRPWPQR